MKAITAHSSRRLRTLLLTALLAGAAMLPAPAAETANQPAQQVPAQVESFALPSEDGQARLTGQIDYPAAAQGPVPLVMMVPGTGLFDRDVDFGTTKGPDSLIFKTLAQALNARGVATLRYDYRGVSCNLRNMPDCKDCQPQQRIAQYIEHCLDAKIRAGVTPANFRADIAQIYKWAAANPRINASRMLAFGHSEGSLHLAHLVKARQIAPIGMVMMGGLTESPSELIHWQSVGRIVDAVLSLDQNHDGSASNEEIKAKASSNDLLALFPLESLLAPEPAQAWTRESLGEIMEAQYQQGKAQTLALDDAAPFGEGGIVQASMAWWKMFFSDQPDPASLLTDYPHPVVYHIGTIDSQVNPARQQAAVAKLPPGHQLRFELHPERGHSLGKHALLGPIEPESQTRLVNSILGLLSQP